MSRLVRVCVVDMMVEKPDPDNEDEIIEVTEEVPFYFYHWGLTAGMLEGKEKQIYTGSWTIAICEHIETGRVHTFIPELIKFVGYAEPEKKDWNRD